MAETANEKLLHDAIRHAIGLQQYSNGAVRKLIAILNASYCSRLPWPRLANQREPTPAINPSHQVCVRTNAALPTAPDTPAPVDRLPKFSPFLRSEVSLFMNTDRAITASPIDEGTRLLASNADPA